MDELCRMSLRLADNSVGFFFRIRASIRRNSGILQVHDTGFHHFLGAGLDPHMAANTAQANTLARPRPPGILYSHALSEP